MQQILENLRRELMQSVDGLSDRDTQARRAPDKWTIQQIVEHLTLTYAATSEAVLARVAKGTPTKDSPSLFQWFGQIAISSWGLFPPGRTAPLLVTPEEQPSRRLTDGELADHVSSSLLGMDSAFAAAEGLFGPKRRAISHLVLGPMSVSQWRRFHLAHGRHHVKQIWRTRKLLAEQSQA